MEAVLPSTHFLPTYELARNGRVLMSNTVATHATHGWPEMTSVYQPAFEAELDRLDLSYREVCARAAQAASGNQQVTVVPRPRSLSA